MSKKKLKIVSDTTTWPRCPYCDKEVEELRVKEYDPIVGKDRLVFFCPHDGCHRILSISAQHDRL